MPRLELESTLLVLPFENVSQLVEYLCEMLRTNQQTETCVRSLLFIFKLYEVATGVRGDGVEATGGLLAAAERAAGAEDADEGEAVREPSRCARTR